MIKNQWYAVLESGEIKAGKMTGVTRLGERLVFWKTTNNEIVCLKDKCAHRGASLAVGKHYGDTIACPFHGFRYDKTGRVTLIPANGRAFPVPEQFRVDSYPCRESQGMIFIWWGDKRDNLPDIPRFPNIDDKFHYCTSVHHWPVHYSRAIENQLDVVHIPFVHPDTIGRGYKTLVNGPVALTKDNQIEFWVYNEKDIGQNPKKAEQLPSPDENRQHLHFIFPNIWQNYVNKQFRIFVAFVPVDESNTVIYLRNYQRFVNVPVLQELTDWLMMIFSKKILNQDRRVVVTQLPIRTELKMGEKLIQGDLPIITYRRIREELKTKNP